MKKWRSLADGYPTGVVHADGSSAYQIQLFGRSVGGLFSDHETADTIARFLAGAWKDIQIIVSENESEPEWVRGGGLPPSVADPLDPAERISLSPEERARAGAAIGRYRERTGR